MSDDEIRVLSYVESNLGGPDSIISRLRPVFHDLIERGLVQEVSYYVLSPDGDDALRAAERAAVQR